MQVAWFLVYHSKAPERKLVGLGEGWKGLGENSSDVLSVCILNIFFQRLERLLVTGSCERK